MRDHQIQKAGFSIADFMAAIDGSRASYYTLDDDLRPRSIRRGRRVIIIEAPADYLARIAALQEAEQRAEQSAPARRAPEQAAVAA